MKVNPDVNLIRPTLIRYDEQQSASLKVPANAFRTRDELIRSLPARDLPSAVDEQRLAFLVHRRETIIPCLSVHQQERTGRRTQRDGEARNIHEVHRHVAVALRREIYLTPSNVYGCIDV